MKKVNKVAVLACILKQAVSLANVLRSSSDIPHFQHGCVHDKLTQTLESEVRITIISYFNVMFVALCA